MKVKNIDGYSKISKSSDNNSNNQSNKMRTSKYMGGCKYKQKLTYST